jgi:hypothetical protein
VDHKPHVSLIDAHAECDRCDDHLDLVFHPRILDFLTLSVGELSMVKIACNLVISFQDFGQLFTILPRDTIDYSRLTFESSFE